MASITKGAALTQPVTDATSDIIVGRRLVSDWDGVVHDYFGAGGERIRTEFMNAIQSVSQKRLPRRPVLKRGCHPLVPMPKAPWSQLGRCVHSCRLSPAFTVPDRLMVKSA
jgi:hypothetical protein